MKISEITSIEVGMAWRGRYALEWKTANARYHVWLDGENRQPDDDGTLYKNPSLGVERHSPTDFRTRHLKIADKANQKVFNHVMAYAVEHNLFDAADRAKRQEEEQEAAVRREQGRIYRIKESAPVLYDALKRVIDSPFEPDKWRLNVQQALAAAEGEPVVLSRK